VPEPAADRATLWLQLLRGLTAAAPGWGVWKNVESALTGIGDLDTSAPPPDWPAIEETFIAWAVRNQLGGVALCRCVPRTTNLIALPAHLPTFLQLEVKGHVTFRGSTLFTAEDLVSLMEMDARGFRTLREGAQGLFKFLTNGLLRGGRPNHPAIKEKKVLELLAADPEGVRAAAALIGPGRNLALAGVDAALKGSWDRPAMLRLEALGLARSLTEPRTLAQRLWFRAHNKRTCPVLKLVYRANRLTPDDPQGWLDEVARTHPVPYRTLTRGESLAT
jgi:hypothetical protein